MKKLNIALIGAGFMGKAHVIGYSNMPKLFWPAPAMPVLKTVCDIMRQPPVWAQDLPLNAAGWVGDFFTKD